ncbi:aldo/keto reductase [Aneurinibacillus sp. UBA3580]|jgi:diketogulonate reductase-like aldo/keto reductase|uniref:aldo/keto reductase n=1 Tax=Aneurinibacillus sp. UBA3580 TaxID=1946041 RepID=UPI00257CE960|nr:aldo/keto reductase [Aneurinibacillus sp. UBA3580]
MIHSISDYTTLHNGVRMPWLGLGVYKTQEGEEVEQAVKAAIEIGYRSIDTAALYHNERGVGNAIKMCGVPREELFITTKVWNSHQGYDATLRAFEESRQKLGLEYLDLYLIHWPVKEKYKDTWRAFEKLYEDGLVRAIGVSNFHVHHLKDLLMDARIIPMVNQVEFHPRLTQKELLRFCKEKGIQMEAWSPLMRGRLLDDPVLNKIGRKYGKTPAQVILRWDLQHGVVTIPKSVHAERIAANADIFDFTLTDEEMNQIDGLNRNERSGQDPDNFQFDF